MATPMGHGLLGLAVAGLTGRQVHKHIWRWYALGIFAANAPDLDLLVGALFGEVNQFHQGPSHSLAAAVAFGLAAVLLVRWFDCSRVRIWFAATSMYVTHLLLDYFCFDGREPYGQPLFWPFSERYFIAEQHIFSGIRHGVPGDSLSVVIDEIFSKANLAAIGTEMLWLTPVLLSAWIIRVLVVATRARD